MASSSMINRRRGKSRRGERRRREEQGKWRKTGNNKNNTSWGRLKRQSDREQREGGHRHTGAETDGGRRR